MSSVTQYTRTHWSVRVWGNLGRRRIWQQPDMEWFATSAKYRRNNPRKQQECLNNAG